MSTFESRYIHGTSSEEQRRLSLMNEFMNEAALRELGLRAGDRVVDVGCGLEPSGKCRVQYDRS